MVVLASVAEVSPAKMNSYGHVSLESNVTGTIHNRAISYYVFEHYISFPNDS